jgi:hypothetical protein
MWYVTYTPPCPLQHLYSFCSCRKDYPCFLKLWLKLSMLTRNPYKCMLEITYHPPPTLTICLRSATWNRTPDAMDVIMTTYITAVISNQLLQLYTHSQRCTVATQIISISYTNTCISYLTYTSLQRKKKMPAQVMFEFFTNVWMSEVSWKIESRKILMVTKLSTSLVNEKVPLFSQHMEYTKSVLLTVQTIKFQVCF